MRAVWWLCRMGRLLELWRYRLFAPRLRRGLLLLPRSGRQRALRNLPGQRRALALLQHAGVVQGEPDTWPREYRINGMARLSVEGRELNTNRRKASKLSPRAIAAIKAAYPKRTRDTANELAERFACSASHVRNIWRGVHWKDA